MSSLTIYQFGSILPRVTIKPDANSQQSVSLMREDILSINFSVPIKVPFRIGDYCHFVGILYQMNKLPPRTRDSANKISYALTMEAEYYDFGKVDFFFLDANNNFTEPVFPLRGTLQMFADLMLNNIKRVFPTANWKLGNVEQTDFQTLEFSAQNCLQALQTICDAFKTEYLFEGKTLNLYQRVDSSGLVLKYGKNNPLLSLSESDQDSSNVITRLYAFGSTRNITSSYRGGSQRLRMGETNYIEKNVDQYNVVEFTILFDGTNGNTEIYPHRTGTVTAVDDPFNFYDSTMDFNVNGSLLPGVTAQIVFNTGLLSGYTFDLSEYDDVTKKFTILKDTEETNIDVPSVNYTPVIGDTYVITQINLPQQYIDQAEADLRAAAQDYINKNSIPAKQYAGSPNTKWFKENNKSFKIATTVQVQDKGMDIDRSSRVVAFTRNINNIYLYPSVDLADTVNPKSIIVKLINGL